MDTQSLIEALDLGPREHIAFGGGGGKTSLMFALAEELTGRNKTVLSSTTTKVSYKEARLAPLVVLLAGSAKMKELGEKEIDGFLAMPFRPEDLVRKVKESMMH